MPIYLDYNATAPVRPEAVEKIQEVLRKPGNPSSGHAFGRLAKKHLEEARRTLATTFNAFPDEIIFTGSGTEANNMALSGIPGRRLLISAIEHSSIVKAYPDAQHIPVTKDGVVDIAALEKLLAADSKPALVSVMLANNETGVIQPISEIAAICKKHGALLHCDAVQGIGKLPIDFSALGADMMTLSGHKCGGPVGAAALIARRGLPVTPMHKGGGQEMGRRAGTENVSAIAAFAVAVQKASDLSHIQEIRGWLDAMESELEAAGGIVFGKNAARLPNTCSVAMPGVSNEVQLIDFDLKGFAVSAGSACTSGKVSGSHVLLAMGVPSETAGYAIRISGGWGTTEKEIRDFTAVWKQTCERLAKKQEVA